MSNVGSFVKKIRDVMRNDPGINGDAQRIEQIAWILFLKAYDSREADWELEDDYQPVIPEDCRWKNWARVKKEGEKLKNDGMSGSEFLKFVNDRLFPTLKRISAEENRPIRERIVGETFSDVNNYMKEGHLLKQVVGIVDGIELEDYKESQAFSGIYESFLQELQSAGSAGEFYTPRAVTDFMAQTINPQIGETMADFACGTGGFIVSWLKELKKKIKRTEDDDLWRNSFYGIEKKQLPYLLCVTNLFLHKLDNPQIFRNNSLSVKKLLDYTPSDQFDVILMNPPYGGSEQKEIKNFFPADLASSETADLFMAIIIERLKQNGRAAVVLPDGFLFGTDGAKVALKKKLLNEFNLHTIVRLPGSVFSPYTSITTNILFFDRTGQTKETWFYRLDMPEGYKHFSKTKPMKLEHFQPVAEWWNDRKEIVVDGFDKAKKYSYKQLSEELGTISTSVGSRIRKTKFSTPAI